nr:hypothetical protein CFP56_42696 [Quercus suber]
MAGATFNVALGGFNVGAPNESFSTKILKLAHRPPTNEFVGWPSIIENSCGLGSVADFPFAPQPQPVIGLRWVIELY